MIPIASPYSQSSSEISIIPLENEEISYQPEGQISGHKVILQKKSLSRKLSIPSPRQKLQPSHQDSLSSAHHPKKRSLSLRNKKLERKTTHSSPLIEERTPLLASSIADDAASASFVDQTLSTFLTSIKYDQDRSESRRESLSLVGREIDPQETIPTELVAPEIALSMQSFIQENFSLLLARADEEALFKFIHEYIQPLPLSYNGVLKAMLSHIQGASPDKIPLLTKVVATILRSMESQHLLIERSTIEQIGHYTHSLGKLTSSALQDAYSSELIQFQLSEINEEAYEACLLCHTWFIPIHSFLLFLCEEALKQMNRPKLSLKLLKMVHTIISQPLVYPISYPILREAYHYFANIPDTEALVGIKRELLRASIPLIEDSSPVILKDSPRTFQGTVKTTFAQAPLVQLKDVTIAMMEAKVTDDMIRAFAWDLKKLEVLFFTQIAPFEFSEFKKASHPASLAPHIQDYIQHINVLGSFVISHILSFSKPQERAQCCMFYIQVMTRSIQIGNLNGALTLLGALEHSSISRLRQTWARVSKKNFLRLEKAKKLFATSNNYANYHHHVKMWKKKYDKMNIKRCLIPLFGNFLTHFTFIDDGNSTLSDDGHLNRDKVLLLAQEHATILKYQTTLSSFKSALLNENYFYDIELYLKKEMIEIHVKGFDEVLNTAYDLSRKLEPPQ